MKFNFILRNIAVFFLMAQLASCASSRRSIVIEEGWELLGQSKVNFVRDIDEIEIRNVNKFTLLRFRVEDREVRLNDLKIYLENGDVLQPALDDVIAADQYSRDITVATEGRIIDKIQFRYRTTGNILRGRAHVLVFGKRYDF